MELTDRDLLEALLVAQNPPARQTCTRKRATRTMSGKRTHCTCGVCHTCRDNDRWERIFQEKFADPTYYLGHLRRDSTLKLN